MLQIIVNGGRGEGKTTAIRVIREALAAAGYEVAVNGVGRDVWPDDPVVVAKRANGFVGADAHGAVATHPVFVHIEEITMPRPPHGVHCR